MGKIAIPVNENRTPTLMYQLRQTTPTDHARVPVTRRADFCNLSLTIHANYKRQQISLYTQILKIYLPATEILTLLFLDNNNSKSKQKWCRDGSLYRKYRRYPIYRYRIVSAFKISQTWPDHLSHGYPATRLGTLVAQYPFTTALVVFINSPQRKKICK